MKRVVRNTLIAIGVGVSVVIVFMAVKIGPPLYAAMVGFHRYEIVPPDLPPSLGETAILIFSKTNGFRDDDSIKASNTALSEIATGRDWSVFVTENGAVFNSEQLRHFKAVVWNNTSGDDLTVDQRAAFKSYMENGGGFVGIHGAGGDPKYAWQWYVDTLIGAQFIGHTLSPQFQQATIRIEDSRNPATRGFEPTWTRTDEWYSFTPNPRTKGIHVLATLDESSYRPLMDFPAPLSWFMKGIDLHMGDHPIIWVHCVGNGRAFFSALGHAASTYSEPQHRKLLEGAMAWAVGLDGSRCANGVETAPESAVPQ